ncbi:MAG: hypothetical protein ACXV8Q_02290 [Methylobacter sp.]
MHPILAAKKDLAVNAFDGPRSSSMHYDSRNDLTSRRMTWHFDYASAIAVTSSKRPTATTTLG